MSLGLDDLTKYILVKNSVGDRKGYYLGTTEEGLRKFAEHNGIIFYAGDESECIRIDAHYQVMPVFLQREIVGV